MIEVEQLSLFTMLSPVPPAVAVCCMDGSRVDATPAESWMQRLVQGGEYVVQVASHPMVLRPADGTADDVPAGHITTPSENACSRACLWEERG